MWRELGEVLASSSVWRGLSVCPYRRASSRSSLSRHRLIDNVDQVFRACESLEPLELLPQRGVSGELNLVTLW